MGMMHSQPAINFKYLALPNKIGGRGGVTRYFFLIHDINYDEELYDMNETWPTKKAELIKSGENPAGSVPVVQYGDITLTQHIAMLRYIAYDLGLGSTAKGNFAQDAIADEYQHLRDAWVTTAFMGGDKDAFKKLTKEKLSMFDALYSKYAIDDTYISVSKNGMPLWGDVALASLLRDIILTGFLTPDELPARIKKVYDAFLAIPAVDNWINN